MRTVRSFANEEAELNHFDVKLKHTLKIVKIKATIYGAWMSSNTVSVYIILVWDCWTFLIIILLL